MTEVREQIDQFEFNFKERDIEFLRERLADKKRLAVEEKNQLRAKEIWILETILDIQEYFLKSFRLLKIGEFYKGWCELERTEIQISNLSKHYDINIDKYKIPFIYDKVIKLQSLFPYRVFFSPEMVFKLKKCSVCGKRFSLRNSCGHKVGEIYNGEICFRNVEQVELLGISLVNNPVQKYSVAFLEDGEDYNYEVVDYLIKKIKTPFQEWDRKWKRKRFDHKNFADIGRNDKCPCGSGFKYKYCCLREDGIMMDYCDFNFSGQ